MVDYKEIGKLKKEYFVEKGYFTSGKIYCLVLNSKGIIKTNTFYVEIEGSVVKKAKGIMASSLTVVDYIKMWQGKSVETAVKTIGYKDYEDGSVTICKEKVTINSEGYTRREKIFNNKGLWINTKPLVIYSESNVLLDDVKSPEISNNLRKM